MGLCQCMAGRCDGEEDARTSHRHREFREV
jgi:hypothetical protein